MEKSNRQNLRRSARIREKRGVANKHENELTRYTEHIEMDTLDRENLRNIIRDYENIVGELLGVAR